MIGRPKEQYTWQHLATVHPLTYICSYCGDKVASTVALFPQGKEAKVRICPSCSGPTFFDVDDTRVPGEIFGDEIPHLPADLAGLYREARLSASAGAPTAAVMVCRKMLMNIAVEQKAEENKKFAYYVDYLASKGYLPPGGEEWVKHIKDRGNEANHEIKAMTPEDARLLIRFVEMLLKFIYEFPKLVPSSDVNVVNGVNR